MKIYFLQEYGLLDYSNDSYNESYIIDLDFLIIEFDMEGNRLNEYNSMEDFYICWDWKEKDIKKAKKNFKETALLTRVY